MVSVESRSICPNCRAFVSKADRVCPYCEAQLGSRAAERTSYAGAVAGLIPHARFTTLMILLINSALYMASMLFSIRAGSAAGAFDIPGGVLFQLGAKFSPAILQGGDWWRLLTAGFLHGGLMHILMNSWALFDLGSQVEEIYGASRLIVFYSVSTIGGFLLSTLWNPGLSVGSSAGIFGLIGVMIALGMSARSALGDHIKTLYVRWAVYGLLFGLLPFFQVDNAAHLGGLAAGFGAAWVAGLPNPFNTASETIWRWVSYVCLALTVYAFARMFLGWAKF
jgi:rhomboid protease GluP